MREVQCFLLRVFLSILVVFCIERGPREWNGLPDNIKNTKEN